MKYPNALEVGSKIAVCALSSGVASPYQARLELVLSQMRHIGFDLVIDAHLKFDNAHVSASKEARARQLMTYLLDDSIDAIMPPWGGEFAMEILPFLDFNALKHAKPKWLIGFSDVSTVQLALSSRLHWASMHTNNLMQLVPKQQDSLTSAFYQAITLTSGQCFVQTASSKFEQKAVDIVQTPDAPYNLNTASKWKTLNFPEQGVNGRLIGGCLDTLISIVDTPYFDLAKFCQCHQNEGVILYIENAELSPTAWLRALLMLKFKGHIARINALLIGRHAASQGVKRISFEQALMQAELDIPIIYDMDIGHIPPNLTLINGAYCEIGQQLKLKQTLI